MPRFDPHPERRPAVVTGASSGIGAAVATALAAAGHPVVLGARRVERCEQLAEALVADGAEAVALHLDLVDPDSVAAFAGGATEVLGAIEVVVSNAGDVQPISTTGADPEEFARQLQVNLAGAQALVSRLVPPMMQRGRGDVVFVTSEVAVRPRPEMAGYVASKAGLEAFAEAMAMECEGTGVRVGIVRPGPCSTEQGSTWAPEAVERIVESWRSWGLMRHGSTLLPEQVAGAIVAMVSVPRGARWASVEVQPEAPVQGDPRERANPEEP
ncbi:MAG: SDR family oxidoreductase [Microthrixaceae bacterium]|nr:SDR family oxidoreductase [Microthrixaceae bacterium]